MTYAFTQENFLLLLLLLLLLEPELGFKTEIWASRLGFKPRGLNLGSQDGILGLEGEIWVSGLGFGLRGWDLSLEAGRPEGWDLGL